jgi:ABC-2 type transport system permease protein
VLAQLLNVRTMLLLLALGPVAALTSLQMAVLISSRVNDPRTAQQFGALLILPLTMVFIAQFNGLLPLTAPIIVLLTAALFLIWLVLVAAGVALFEREAILTRWK